MNTKTALLRLVSCTFLFGLLFSTVSCSLFHEDLLDLENGEGADISVEELYKRMTAATDPKGLYAKAKTYKLVQEVESVSEQKSRDFYNTVVLFKDPDFIKQVSIKNGKAFMMILYKNGEAWYINPVNMKNQKIPNGTPLNLVKAFTGMLKPGNQYNQIFKTVDIDVNYQAGKKYYRLICRVDDPGIAPYVFYIDAETYLTRSLETILYTQGGGRSLYTAISEDYAWFSGVKMAKKTLVTVGGKTDVTRIVSFVLNPELPDADFSLNEPWIYDK